MPSLAETLDEVRLRIRRAGNRPLNEQNTKAPLIEPVLRALGRDVEDIEELQREFCLKSRDKPVDYGLLPPRRSLWGNMHARLEIQWSYFDTNDSISFERMGTGGARRVRGRSRPDKRSAYRCNASSPVAVVRSETDATTIAAPS